MKVSEESFTSGWEKLGMEVDGALHWGQCQSVTVRSLRGQHYFK